MSQRSLSRRQFLRTTAVLPAIFIVPRHVLGGKGYLAPSDKITLGFIGCGRQGFGLKDAFLKTEEVQILAASDVYTNKRDTFAAKVNEFHAAASGASSSKSCSTYADFRELLERKDVDAIVMAAPDHWHAALVVRAAAAGKDVYGEKPLSLTVREGRAMVKAIRKHDRVFQTGSMQRSWAEFRQAVELVRNGYIGEIKTVKVSVGGPPAPYNLPAEEIPAGLDWQFWLGPNAPVSFNSQLAPTLGTDIWARWRYFQGLGGGDVTDWGAHMFDIAQWGLDKDSTGPVEIIAPDGKDHPFLTFRYADGITMTHEDFGKRNAVRFIGSKGTIDVQRGKLETTPAGLKDKVIGPNEKRVYFSDNHYKDFLKAVRNRTRPICDIETGHRSATVGNLGNIAYQLKRSLKWDPEKETFAHDKEANHLLGRKMHNGWHV
ncbi:MAG: Gfo/Idh/MocA family oxidoreductase [Bacteroidetes bacterium]|nr:Gfo/Idh/MocA family oxidoreductase [Bacteroidota bacterium]